MTFPVCFVIEFFFVCSSETSKMTTVMICSNSFTRLQHSVMQYAFYIPPNKEQYLSFSETFSDFCWCWVQLGFSTTRILVLLESSQFCFIFKWQTAIWQEMKCKLRDVLQCFALTLESHLSLFFLRIVCKHFSTVEWLTLSFSPHSIDWVAASSKRTCKFSLLNSCGWPRRSLSNSFLTSQAWVHKMWNMCQPIYLRRHLWSKEQKSLSPLKSSLFLFKNLKSFRS